MMGMNLCDVNTITLWPELWGGYQSLKMRVLRKTTPEVHSQPLFKAQDYGGYQSLKCVLRKTTPEVHSQPLIEAQLVVVQDMSSSI